MLSKKEFEIMKYAPDWAVTFKKCGGFSVYSVSHCTSHLVDDEVEVWSIKDLRKQHEDDLSLVKHVCKGRGISTWASTLSCNCIKEMSDHAGHAAFVKYLIDLELSKMEKDKMSEYKLIENPDIFELKSDFEAGKLYYKPECRKFEILTAQFLCRCLANQAPIYRKQHWTDNLDGTKGNAVWCQVWDDFDSRSSSPTIRLVLKVIKGGYHTKSLTWDHAEPVPAEMVDFIN